MRKLFLLLILISFVVFPQDRKKLTEENHDIDSNAVLQPEIKHFKINKVISRILTRYHYNRANLNDSLSSVIFDKYLKSLDNNRMYFLQSDIDEFEKDRYHFDEYLYTGKLDAAYKIFNVFKKRVNERMHYVMGRLEKPFDFTKDEYVDLDRSEMDFVKTEAELDDLWRRRIKHEALNLKLADKEADDIKSTLTTRYQRYHKIILQYKSEDVFQLYMNAFGNMVDPHTSYFSPITSENFKINMSLSLEGIGAQLQADNDYTKVSRIIPGGPADKAGELKAGDRIVAVGQGNDGEMVDVIGWRLDDVVQLIRGDKGTTVKLSVLKAENGLDMEPEEIKIKRDKVRLEEQAAQKEVIEIEHEGKKVKLGVIDLPAFYIDFEGRANGDPNYKSTTKDVKRLISELKEEDVEGIIIDLRNNGGGSLDEAIDLTGLFIEQGPVVQVKQLNGRIEVGADEDPSISYNGPLAVLVNRFSASASEIFAGAIQDYGRGLIIGEQTFGKGTVQNLLDLSRFMNPSEDKMGQLKLTIAKYYRITGSSTQHKGVEPDVKFPSALSAEEYGESSYESALPWDQINTSNFSRYANIKNFKKKLVSKHDKRVKNDKEFNYLVEDVEEMKANHERTRFSLNETVRKSEREKREAKREARKAEREKLSEKKGIDEGEVLDDVRLLESGHILADLILMAIK